MPSPNVLARRILAGAAITCVLGAGLSGCVLAPVAQNIMGTQTPAGSWAPQEAPTQESDSALPESEPDEKPAPTQKPSAQPEAPAEPAPSDTPPVLGPPDAPPPAPTVTTRFTLPLES